MNGILYKITTHKIGEVEETRRRVSLAELIEKIETQPSKKRSMRSSLANDPFGIIAEFKRKSPSKGWLHPDAEVTQIVPNYQSSGAAASSVLTDQEFFGGSLDDLIHVRPLVEMPLLRKEFIVDPYQLYEAKAAGADAILLIAACLTPHKCYALAELAHSLGLEVLLEIHHEGELDHLNRYVDMLGVNNRNLDTFHTDVETSFRLARMMRERTDAFDVPPLLISESGLSDADTVLRLKEAGFQGFLMGETFMRNDRPGEALQQFISALR